MIKFQDSRSSIWLVTKLCLTVLLCHNVWKFENWIPVLHNESCWMGGTNCLKMDGWLFEWCSTPVTDNEICQHHVEHSRHLSRKNICCHNVRLHFSILPWQRYTNSMSYLAKNSATALCKSSQNFLSFYIITLLIEALIVKWN